MCLASEKWMFRAKKGSLCRLSARRTGARRNNGKTELSGIRNNQHQFLNISYFCSHFIGSTIFIVLWFIWFFVMKPKQDWRSRKRGTGLQYNHV
jgi:hypothetical protein